MLRRCLTSLLSISLFALSLFPATTSLAQAAESKSQIRFYHPDHLGSTTDVTDKNGQVVEHIEYKPFGEIHRREIRDPNTGKLIAADIGSSVSPFGFTGQRLDDSTGLYFYNSRYYDPSLGRFTQPDSIVQAPSDPQTLNRYSYVCNNPINYTDPSGHGWFKKFFEKIWDWFKDKYTPQPSDPQWWANTFGPRPIVAPGTAQQFNQIISATATFMVNQWGFSPAAANATIGAVLAIPTGGNSLIAAGLAYGTTELLGTSEARQLIGSLAGFFEQFGVSPEAARTLATQVVSAGVAVAVSVASSATRELYVKLARYEPMWEKGGAAVAKDPFDLPVPGANNVGTAGPLNPNGLFNEGGILSRLLNPIPGVNAVSGPHDTFQVRLQQWGGRVARIALNVPGMPPAAAITYIALLRPQEVYLIYGVVSNGAQSD